MSTQPKFKLVAQLGDKNPIDHGGYFVYIDETGVYSPEAELLIAPDNDDGKWEIRRFILEPCTFINGILSDNKFHPESPAWFADGVGEISNFVGIPTADLIDMFCNGNIENRAIAWLSVGDYHGFENLDSYPLYLTRSQAESRYND